MAASIRLDVFIWPMCKLEINATVSVEHQLVSTPIYANLTPKDNLEGRTHWYNGNSTHMSIHISSGGTSKSHSFNWYAGT